MQHFLQPIVFAGFALCFGSAMAHDPLAHNPVPAKGDALTTDARLGVPAKGASNGAHRLGERTPLVPPFLQVFDDYTSGQEFDLFERYYQVINGDGDKNPSGSDRSWGYYNFNGESGGRQYSKCAYLQYPINVNVCDDWLIPWAIKLDADKYYYVYMDASLYVEGSTHRFEVKMGRYNDAAGMTTEVIPATDVTSILPTQCGGWFKPDRSGNYYMGIHGISNKFMADGGYLFIDNIGVEAARSGNEPNTVSDVKFTTDPNGRTMVDIEFNAPSTSIDGNALSGNVTVEIRRAGELVKTLSCTPGQQGVKYTDAAPAKGNYQYSFTTITDAGKGVEIKLNTFVGLTTPKAPVITSITEKKQGEVTLAWAAPETDVNGAAINPAALAYNIYDGLDEGFVLRENGYTETEYSFDYGLADGEQTMVMMGVTATFDEEESARAYSDYIFVGTPYTIPHANSFTSLDIAIGADGDDGILWRMLDSFSDPKPQDGDNGYICMIGTMPDQYGELSTGKLDFTNVKAPYISFYTYNYQDDYNELAVIVQDVATGERTTVQKYSLDTLPIGWTQIMCPLDGFSGKIVHVIIGATINTHGYVPVDNLVIDELPAVDLTIKNFSHSSYASAGEKFYVEAVVENHGAKGVDSFTANLLMDGKVIDTVKGDALAAFESAFVVLQGSFSAVSPENSTFNIEIIVDGDADLSNNLSEAFNIAFLAPVHPVATGLTATEDNGKVVLNWTAPDLSKAAPADVTEDFESYPSFIADLDGFTMYDADGGFPTGISGVAYPMVGQPQAFWTQRSEGEYIYFSTRGACSLVTMATVDSSKRPIPNDDWLISPELYGGRQSISFWACSQTIQYGFETFEVYASSTGTNISDFTKVLYETQVPEEWTKYYVSLPAGTRYFAIRCTSNDRYFFTLDDINYIPAGTPEPLELLGYNVYRNGEKVNDDPVVLTTFDTERDLAGDDYFVTAVYDKGESTSSNVAHLGAAGIDGIEAEQGSAVYYDLRGIAVSAADLTPGVYVRRIGSRVEKVVIR